jgi:hypothetical protein
MCDLKDYATIFLLFSACATFLSIPCYLALLFWIEKNETKRLSKYKETNNV